MQLAQGKDPVQREENCNHKYKCTEITELKMVAVMESEETIVDMCPGVLKLFSLCCLHHEMKKVN